VTYQRRVRRVAGQWSASVAGIDLEKLANELKLDDAPAAEGKPAKKKGGKK
jgi:hypothetical protein